MTAQQEILAKYGEPGPEYQRKYCEVWSVQEQFPWFPVKNIFINKDFAAKLTTAFSKLQAMNLHREIKTFDGCYNDRKVRGKSVQSLHSWAMAIDLNASIEKLGQTTTHFSEALIKIMIESGIFWGGNYHGRKDPMHFSLYNG